MDSNVRRFLERKFELRVNEKKSQVAETDRTNFLGFAFKGTRIRWSDKAFREFKRRVKHPTGGSRFVSMEYRYKKLARCIRGWMNRFGISEHYRPIPEIDHRPRRRPRMCCRKQWRHVRAEIRNLLELGTRPGLAVPMRLARKGPWRSACTMATRAGMPDKWLKDQGFVFVKEPWVKIHCPVTAR